MKSALTIAALVLVGLGASVRPAQANIWDWMQEWSGPGPFQAYKSTLLTFCPTQFSLTEHPCFFVDLAKFVNNTDNGNDKDNFPKVTAWFLDSGASWRLRRPIAIGIGLGRMSTTANLTARRWTLTLPRVTIEPFALGAELIAGKGSLQDATFWEHKNNYWWKLSHLLKFQAKGNYILGRLTGDDLGVSGTGYDRTNQYVISRGLILDFGELLAPPLGKKIKFKK